MDIRDDGVHVGRTDEAPQRAYTGRAYICWLPKHALVSSDPLDSSSLNDFFPNTTQEAAPAHDATNGAEAVELANLDEVRETQYFMVINNARQGRFPTKTAP